MNQPQRFVVHQDDFHIQLVFGCSRHFLNVHHQATVAGEADDLAVRIGERRAHSCGQAKAHGAQTAGGQPLARTVQRIGLSGPHLMLTHVGGDDRAVVHAGGHGVDQPVVAQRVAFGRDGTRELLL
ncbi:hypothetical protein D3C76_1266060 [compost metagenome]